MQMDGSQIVLAPIEVVWRALLDSEVLSQCVPGCQEMTGDAESGFAATVVQRVGPVKATFRGEVTLESMVPPNTLTLKGEGKGGVAGFAKGEADVTLTQDGDETRIDYVVRANIGGKLARLGSRIIDSFAAKMADQFFVKFKEAIEVQEGVVAAPEGKS